VPATSGRLCAAPPTSSRLISGRPARVARRRQSAVPTHMCVSEDISGASASAAAGETGEDDDRTEQQKENDRLRAAERFIQVDEGRFECPTCAYVYEPTTGEVAKGIASGTAFKDISGLYSCPVCKTPKAKFFPIKKVIAGFADNQRYGFGTNSMTGAQKNGLIFGSLAFLFLLLLSGYALN
jgi:rubredoxin